MHPVPGQALLLLLLLLFLWVAVVVILLIRMALWLMMLVMVVVVVMVVMVAVGNLHLRVVVGSASGRTVASTLSVLVVPVLSHCRPNANLPGTPLASGVGLAGASSDVGRRGTVAWSLPAPAAAVVAAVVAVIVTAAAAAAGDCCCFRVPSS